MENNNQNIPESGKDIEPVVPEVSAEEITVSAMEGDKKAKKQVFSKAAALSTEALQRQ